MVFCIACEVCVVKNVHSPHERSPKPYTSGFVASVSPACCDCSTHDRSEQKTASKNHCTYGHGEGPFQFACSN